MKKWLIIALVGIAFSFLIVRAFYIRLARSKNERPWYVKNLGFHFSANVDSLKAFSTKNGLVYFHVTNGDLNLAMEEQVNKKIKYNGRLQFILHPEGKLTFHSRDLNKYAGDSLAINSSDDKIYIYRHGELASSSEISQALSGRPF